MNPLGFSFPEPYIPRSSYRVATPPAVEPVTVAQVRDEFGLGPEPPSGVIERMIRGARELAEAYTGRAFITQAIEMQLDTFPAGREPWWDGVRQGARRALAPDAPIPLYRSPVQAITSVTWTDSSGTDHTMDPAAYDLDQIVEPNRLLLAEGASWPADPRVRAAVRIAYTAGYGPTPATVPALVIEAILAHLRDQFERPNAGISSETIDNASTVYGAQGLGATASSKMTGALRGDAAALLASLRINPVT